MSSQEQQCKQKCKTPPVCVTKCPDPCSPKKDSDPCPPQPCQQKCPPVTPTQKCQQKCPPKDK
ncbi:small proline-rich protein 2E-like [Balaenoptera acutorostrata]|uniref:Small proline-rich protein 2E-like n=1 Tax=Balaenoptera acutorostrata TaxID=9767 RepID=A0A452CA02_BALAC|nr:small proline-rich protein 2E-like [Balaenoptera acutorostrata]